MIKYWIVFVLVSDESLFLSKEIKWLEFYYVCILDWFLEKKKKLVREKKIKYKLRLYFNL